MTSRLDGFIGGFERSLAEKTEEVLRVLPEGPIVSDVSNPVSSISVDGAANHWTRGNRSPAYYDADKFMHEGLVRELDASVIFSNIVSSAIEKAKNDNGIAEISRGRAA